jgi:uncharacterized damage-inducible protein DinB
MNYKLAMVGVAALVGLAACEAGETAADEAKEAAGAMAASNSTAAVMAIRGNWDGMIKNITIAAEEWPEADYGYKPIATVRSFGELVAHVAGAQDMICAVALGEPMPAEDAVETTAKTKDAIVAALKASTEHCAKAYAITDAQGTDKVSLFGADNTKMGALALNAVHDGEHYGNVVTYMRMKGMVPPSSRGQ